MFNIFGKKKNKANNNFAGQAAKEINPQEADINKYKDLGGMTVKKLDWGLWYVENRELMRKIIIGILVSIGAVSWSYAIYGFAYYFAKGMDEDRILLEQITRTGIINSNYFRETAPKRLLIDMAKVIKMDEGKYDFLCQIKNQNENRGAEFDYSFMVDNIEVGRQRGFILPKETKYLLSLGRELDSNPSGVQLKIDNLHWLNINRHEILDWVSFRNDRLNFNISDIKFSSESQSGLSEKVSLNDLKFTASNKTPFNYWNVDFSIILSSGAEIVGVNNYSISEFFSGQSRDIAMTWPGLIGFVGKIDVVPEINIFRDDIYMRYSGEGGVK